MCVRVCVSVSVCACVHFHTMSHRRVLASISLSVFKYAYYTTFRSYLLPIQTQRAQTGKAAGITLRV